MRVRKATRRRLAAYPGGVSGLAVTKTTVPSDVMAAGPTEVVAGGHVADLLAVGIEEDDVTAEVTSASVPSAPARAGCPPLRGRTSCANRREALR